MPLCSSSLRCFGHQGATVEVRWHATPQTITCKQLFCSSHRLPARLLGCLFARSRRFKSPYRGRVHRVGPRHVRLRFAIRKPLQRLGALMRRELQKWPVSRRVNSSRASDDDVTLIDPVPTDPSSEAALPICSRRDTRARTFESIALGPCGDFRPSSGTVVSPCGLLSFSSGPSWPTTAARYVRDTRSGRSTLNPIASALVKIHGTGIPKAIPKQIKGGS
jgi:hypothetical protein